MHFHGDLSTTEWQWPISLFFLFFQLILCDKVLLIVIILDKHPHQYIESEVLLFQAPVIRGHSQHCGLELVSLTASHDGRSGKTSLCSLMVSILNIPIYIFKIELCVRFPLNGYLFE